MRNAAAAPLPVLAHTARCAPSLSPLAHAAAHLSTRSPTLPPRAIALALAPPCLYYSSSRSEPWRHTPAIATATQPPALPRVCVSADPPTATAGSARSTVAHGEGCLISVSIEILSSSSAGSDRLSI